MLSVTVGPVFRCSSSEYPFSEAGDAGDLGMDVISVSRLCVFPGLGLARVAEEVACAVPVLLYSCRDTMACRRPTDNSNPSTLFSSAVHDMQE